MATLNQLRAFLLSARTGTFTAAAVEMGTAQASVSELIRRLEAEYGLDFFVRGGRRLILTAAGEELLPHAEHSVEAADNGAQALRSLRSLGGGVATFGLLRNANYYLLSGLIEPFLQRHPQVRVRLVGLNSVGVAAAVASGELEAGLVVLPIDDTGLRVTPLMRDEVFFATATPERAATPVTMDQFAQSRLILYDAHVGWSDPTRRQLSDRAQLRGLKLEPWVEVEHVESALALVSHGVGDTIICKAVADHPAFPDNIHIAPFEERLYDTVALIQRESGALSPATAELMHLARRMLLRGRKQQLQDATES
ncbi:LysR family transcriptional regulator [Nocardioides zhouii]|uniref:LysR family transcriptional regulator n=1 Tax=Nocardioides zhouii TaxID=1168729 RepID=A0A4Q2SPL5_9ACTN|nr:LysR family transcriptional regulator [Nocardioides zhouii]RYC07273.1 LysR family transcriptional regulator [Nocardioides zhouii]